MPAQWLLHTTTTIPTCAFNGPRTSKFVLDRLDPFNLNSRVTGLGVLGSWAPNMQNFLVPDWDERQVCKVSVDELPKRDTYTGTGGGGTGGQRWAGIRGC